MGCGCGGSGAAGTRRNNPLVLGEDQNDQPAQRVVLVQGTAGTPAGARRWVRGTDVQTMIEEGVIKPL